MPMRLLPKWPMISSRKKLHLRHLLHLLRQLNSRLLSNMWLRLLLTQLNLKTTQLMITDEQVSTTVDEEAVEVGAVQEEVEEEAPQEVFVVVEEMPSFPGGC